MQNKPGQRGFTIVELLVVVVVIGILASFVIISYNGINQKAISASLQSDLSSAATELKMYFTDNGSYPQSLNGSYCPQNPADARYCLKSSSGNSLTYCSLAPYNGYTLADSSSNGTTYKISDSLAPYASSGVIFASGGTISSSDCVTRTHTFSTPGSYVLTAVASGTVTVTINGGGGGGGGAANECSVAASGAAGGNTSIAYGGGTWIANGGGGGVGDNVNSPDPCSIDVPGTQGANGGSQVQGNATLSGWTTVNGGGAAGGAGGKYGTITTGGPGGPGGKLVGTLSISQGQTFTVNVGQGGVRGNYDMAGTNGSDGSVIISYTY